MTHLTIPLSAIEPPAHNPRTQVSPEGLEGLAASIRADGLLHNLVVERLEGPLPRYRLISGERRLLALQLLIRRGDLPVDYGVPVSVREHLSQDETLRIATVENLQREELPPLDEMAALTRLARDGERLADLAAQTGLRETTIRRRLRLNHLCEEARAVLREGHLTLAQAEALTLGDAQAQRGILEDLAKVRRLDAEDIRDFLLDDKYPVELAAFPLELYTSTRTRDDLFDDGDYFDDAGQFWELQRQAVADLADRHAETAAWVEVNEDYHIPTWSYDDAKEGAPSGVLINLAPSGKVTVLTGLVKRSVDPAFTQAKPKKPKPAYSAALCCYIAHHKSIAVQCRLLGDARKAKELAAVQMLGAADDWRSTILLVSHDCLRAFSQSDNPPFAYREIAQEAQACMETLGLAESGQDAWTVLVHHRKDAVSLYEAVKALSDQALDRLLLLLPVLCFGQTHLEALDTGDTLFNRVSQDLGMDMRAYWRPDAEFLTRRTLPQLTEIAREAGLSTARNWRKPELVSRLLRHFEEAHATTSDLPAYRKACEWLPEAMRFPAVDPSAAEAPAENHAEAEDEAWEEAA
jgi:ParB family transcriptional regulator, chromosome partitioning protein